MKKFANFLFELGQLKRIRHEGWRLAGAEQPESVAEHSLRAAQIAYILAILENHPKPEEICTMTVFHDLAECRIGDIHKVANRYIEVDEEKVVKDQVAGLGKIGEKIFTVWRKSEGDRSVAGIITKDADYLEQAITAKELVEKGHKSAADWIKNVSKHLKTKSAKKLLNEIKKSESTDWWQGLKKLGR